MKLLNLKCTQGHPIGNITFKSESGPDRDNRKYVRKIIDDVFYCQTCKKFYKMVLSECDFIPRSLTKGDRS